MATNRIAFFDFCETLTDFQTADAYVDFVRRHKGTRRMKVLEGIQQLLGRTKIIRLPEKLTMDRLSVNKRLKLYQLKGFDRKELENLARRYYEDEIKPHFIDQLVKLLQQRKRDGWRIVLVSGGYDIYLKYFAEEFQIDKIISTRIRFDGDICKAKFDGLDCLNENKVKLLNTYFDKKEITESEGYSDSHSDIPFLSWVNKGFVVSRDKHQDWAKKFNFNEILWTRNK